MLVRKREESILCLLVERGLEGGTAQLWEEGAGRRKLAVRVDWRGGSSSNQHDMEKRSERSAGENQKRE